MKDLEQLGDKIADITTAIFTESRKIELHDQAARQHRAAAVEYRRQHGEDAELPPEIYWPLDLAEMSAMNARAERRRLEKALAEDRKEWMRTHPSPIAATRLLDEIIEKALGGAAGEDEPQS